MRFFYTKALGIFLIAAFAAAGCSDKSQTGRIFVLGMDGMDPGVVDLLMSEGKMPNFARLRQEGAYGRFTSMRPILSPIIWTTIATGKMPNEHKIGHFVAVNDKTGEQIPVTSRMREVKALWNVFSEAARSVAVVGWWATWPAEEVRGTIVSDHTCYHFLFDEGSTGGAKQSGVVYPEEKTEDILSMVRRPRDLPFSTVARFVDVEPEDFERPFDFADELAHFKWALATAESYRDIGLRLWREEQPDAEFLYIEGVDSTSHLFGHLFRAEGLAGELAEQQARYGRAVEEMYLFADEILGAVLAEIGADTTLMVLSDHGFELGRLHGDPSKTRDMRRVSEAFHKIEGILYLYGNGIKKHARIEKPGLLDVAPTLLALSGLPIPADMKGRVLGEAFVETPSISSIASYETGAVRTAPLASEGADVDDAILGHLESLGYLETESPQGDRNLAALHFEAGRYEESVAAFGALIDEQPDDGSLRASLAGALGALGRYDEALVQLDEAVRLAPLNPESYHNRGVIFERVGRIDEAIAQYRQALRYRPDYPPSHAALERLGVPARPEVERTPNELRAANLAEEAGEAARHGDYARAMRTLDEAESLAPGLAVVYAYRANVAFLMDDRGAALAALQKALEIEPDNALYLQNLRYLQREREPAETAPATAPNAGSDE